MDENKKTEIVKKIEALKDSPLYAMSLGGRELYHSNFWVWLMEQDKQFIKVFFEKIENVERAEITREEGNRDITITIGNNVYVIENKLKSIATKEQLKKYQIKLGDKFARGILTGISEDFDLSNDNDLKENWHFLSYDTLCDNIGEVLKSSSIKDDFKKCVIHNYINDTRNISALIKKIVPEKDNINTWDMRYIDSLSKKDMKLKLSDIRMDDLGKKKWANLFAEKLKEDLELNFEEEIKSGFTKKKYKLSIQSGFTNKQPLVEVFYRAIDDKDDEDNLIGIQIQGTQYRRCFSESGDKANLVTTFKLLLDKKWFAKRQDSGHGGQFNWIVDIKDSTVPYKTNQRKKPCKKGEKLDYCKYEPSFIYQYRTLQESEDENLKDGFSFKSIKESIEKDIKFAKEVLLRLGK